MSRTLRYTAWTLPWSAVFKQTVAHLPVPEGTGRGSKTFLGVDTDDGEIMLNHGQFNRVGEVISDTVGSLIRVYDGETIIDEWLSERTQERTTDEERLIGVAGPGLPGAFDKAFVYPVNYPENPSLSPNWKWGDTNQLGNPGFEESAVSVTKYILTITATGGTFTLTDGTDTTSAIGTPFDDLAATIANEIEADIGSLSDVVVDRTSIANKIYLIQYVTPPFGPTLTVNTGFLTGGTATLVPDQTGGLSPKPWTIAHNFAEPAPPDDAYPFFGVVDDNPRTGLYSLYVDPPNPGLISNRSPGIQQEQTVIPGSTYQASIWVEPEQSTDIFRLRVVTDGEEILASTQTTLSTGSYQQLSLSNITIPDGVTTVAIRLQQVNAHPHVTGNYWVDDGFFGEGFLEDTPGGILELLFADAQSDHASDPRGVILDWVDISSFDGTNDSNGVPWTGSHSFVASFGESYGQILDKFVDLGYEWELVPKATPSGGFTHDLHVYNSGGCDTTPSTAITIGQGVKSGDVVKRIPAYTRALVQGAGGIYVEEEDATADTNFGPIEKFFRATWITDTVTLTQYAESLLAAEAANRKAVRFELFATDVHPHPIVSYRPGDSVPMQNPPSLPKETRRVHRVDYVNTNPTEYAVTGSRVFSGEAAAMDLVRRLWRRFSQPDADTTIAVGGAGTVIPPLGAFIHLVVEPGQSIPDGGTELNFVGLETLGENNWSPFVPIFPATEVAVPLNVYYDIKVVFRWDSWLGGGRVRFFRTRGGSPLEIWPPLSEAIVGQWDYDLRSRVFNGVAKGIALLPGDLITVFVDSESGSSQDIAGGYMTIEAVEKGLSDGAQDLFIFTEDGTFDWDAAGQPETLDDVWIFGGGGGGPGNAESTDWKGGGGGAGGLVHLTDYAVSGDVAVVVGEGGVGTDDGTATNGGDSSFDGQTAPGGGNGGQGTTQASGSGLSGGCGGGGTTAGAVSSGTGGTGSDGGDGGDAPVAGNAGGGGGGVSEDGADGASGVGGDGGDGIDLSSVVGFLYGDSGRFGGGGGGWGGSGVGVGGVGGGGAAGSGSAPGEDGIVNSAGGGGAAHGGDGVTGGNGGKGIVIVRVRS